MKNLLVFKLLLVISILYSCTSPIDDDEINTTIELSENGIVGTYTIPSISIHGTERGTLVDPILNDWYISYETNIKSEAKDISLKITFNPDKTYSINGSFIVKSDYSKNDYFNSTIEFKEYEKSNNVNSSGTYEVFKDTTLNNVPKKGLLVLSPGFNVETHNDLDLSLFSSSPRGEWYVDVLEGNYMKLSNWDFDFIQRWRAEQTIVMDVIKEN